MWSLYLDPASSTHQHTTDINNTTDQAPGQQSLNPYDTPTTLEMSKMNFNLRHRAQLHLSIPENQNNYSQQDISEMQARISALEAKVEDLQKNQNSCAASSVALPRERPSDLVGLIQHSQRGGQDQGLIGPSNWQFGQGQGAFGSKSSIFGSPPS